MTDKARTVAEAGARSGGVRPGVAVTSGLTLRPSYPSHAPSRITTLPRSSGTPRQARTVCGATHRYR
ncbi:hypothetical protein GCM10018980_23100 [Streptomyces capoamus]|uniref:Uncharacterized protein n=1 Tax=Streptomyces capoamus TaxID=68183 RepID=A0A919C591_9ACTN|nr:hypothetical protein GCM10010501_00790 [Streptomyces libani subsp. rufus]GHG44833.1 hypothetical protein GCM10018980_23100 [Streptomyces capoamus]